MASILIAGCGDVGCRLGLRLAAAGHQVWGLKRNPSTLPSAIHPLAADLSVADSLTVMSRHYDYVFYTAAAGGFSEARYRAAYYDGVVNLLAALRIKPKRLLFTSSTSVYGQTNGAWVDETSPAESASFAGSILRQAEQFIWNGPCAATVVRFAGIYGPGRTRLIDSVRNRTAHYVEGVYGNRIHSDDCAAVLAHIMTLAQPEPLYIGVDDAPVLQSEVLAWLAKRLSVPAPTQTEAADTLESRQRSNKRCRNTRLKASGFNFHYPSYREGYAELLTTLQKALPEKS